MSETIFIAPFSVISKNCYFFKLLLVLSVLTEYLKTQAQTQMYYLMLIYILYI